MAKGWDGRRGQVLAARAERGGVEGERRQRSGDSVLTGRLPMQRWGARGTKEDQREPVWPTVEGRAGEGWPGSWIGGVWAHQRRRIDPGRGRRQAGGQSKEMRWAGEVNWGRPEES